MPRYKKTRASTRRNSTPTILANSPIFLAALRQEAANGALDALAKAGLLPVTQPPACALTPLRRAIIFKLGNTPGMGLSVAEIAEAVYPDAQEVARIINRPYQGNILTDIQDGSLIATKAAVIRHLAPLFAKRHYVLAGGVGVNQGRVSETLKPDGRIFRYPTVTAADRFEDETRLEDRTPVKAVRPIRPRAPRKNAPPSKFSEARAVH